MTQPLFFPRMMKEIVVNNTIKPHLQPLVLVQKIYHQVQKGSEEGTAAMKAILNFTLLFCK
jgi:hypothetical protein